MKRSFLFLILLLIFSNLVYAKAYVIPIKGVIDLGLSAFVKRSIDEARDMDIDFIIFDIDTFGGRLDAALDICNYIEKIKQKNVIAFVNNKAWSAGALIALACSEIFLSPTASIGSAQPRAFSFLSEENIKDEKIISAIRAQFKSLASANNHPVNLALAMVDEDFGVKQVKIKDEIKILTDKEIEDLRVSQPDIEIFIIKTINQSGKLLNLTAYEAYEFGLAKDIVEDINKLAEYLGIKDIVFSKLNWSENLVRFITNPLISSLLLAFGLLGLFFEFKTPGFGIFGILGILFLSLFFWGHYLAGLANWIEIIIFIVGIFLLFLEIFVLPGFGIAGISGIGLIIFGTFLALFKYPTYFFKLQIFRAFYILSYSIIFLFIGIFLILKFFSRSSIFKSIILLTSERKQNGFLSLSSLEKYLNRIGTTLTVLRPSGKVDFDGDVQDAVANLGFIQKGKRVKVIDVKGLNLIVEEIDE